MTPEQLCTSYLLSSRLYDLGVRAETCFYWDIEQCLDMPNREFRKMIQEDTIFRLPAYTASELGEILPSRLNMERFFYCWKDDRNMWRVHYTQWGQLTPYMIEKFNSEADARAKMLIYLIENKLITV